MRSAAARARSALLKYRAELEQVHAHLEQAHAAHIAEIDLILGELGADIAGMPKVPIRNLILAAVQTSPRRGRTRAQIISFIDQHFGIVVKPSTATVTLNRLHNQGLVTFANGFWLPLNR
jgi:hypothetical protein